MTLTLTEKLLARASGRTSVKPGEIVVVEPDVVLSHDNSAAIWEIFQRLPQGKVKHPDRLAITLDHAVPPPTAKHAQNHAQIRQLVQAQSISNFFEIGRGICHQVLCEEGIVGPGLTLLGADSHSPHCGWLGAVGAGIGRSEVAALWATGELWLRVPETMRIMLSGRLERGVTTKDLTIHLIGQLSSDGATYMAVEFAGDGIGSLSPDGRAVLTNMMAEMGAKNACMAPDSITWDWLNKSLARTRPQDAAERLAFFRESALYPDAKAGYAVERHIELSDIEPMVSCPHAVDNVQPLSSVAHTRVDVGFIGTCTNGRLEDIASAAEILRGKRLRRRLLIIPASSLVLRRMRPKPAMSRPCWMPARRSARRAAAPAWATTWVCWRRAEVCISSANRNFRGRMGQRDAEIYLANPAVVAASCVAGYLAHPLELAGGEGAMTKTSHRVWKYDDNVNTDVIFPGKYTYTISQEPAALARHALEDLDPSFAANVRRGDVIVAGRNWGNGSSREQAVTCLRAAGVQAVIASSFARIYYRNAINSGLLVIECPPIVEAVETGDEIEIDMEATQLLALGRAYDFPPLPPQVRDILDAGGIIPWLQASSPRDSE